MRSRRMDSRQCDLYYTWDSGGRDRCNSFDLHFHGFLQYCVERYPHWVSKTNISKLSMAIGQ
jgi:hypothetical protein